MPRVSKFSDAEFEEIFLSDLDEDKRASKLGISVQYMRLKAKKLKIKREDIKKPVKQDTVVIVIERGTYTRSYCTYESDAVVKAKELRELVECNDTNFVPTDFEVRPMTEEEQEKETFMVSKLKRNYGEPHV